MSLPSKYRWIIIGSLAIRNRSNAPSDAPEWEIDDLISALNQRFSEATHHREYSKNNRLMWCSEISGDNNFHHLLIESGDKNVSGVSFINFDDKTTRDVEKEENEGGHYSAHIIISKSPDENGNYKILVEKVPSVFFAALEMHFGWALNSEQFKKTTKNKDGSVKSYKPVFRISGFQSKTIRDALKTGVLQDIEFVGYMDNHPDGLDEDPIIEEELHEAKWEIRKSVSDEQAAGLFTKAREKFGIFRSGKKEAQLLVRIKSGNGQVKQTEIDADSGEILEQAFYQNEMVNQFDTPLSQRHASLRADMITKMKNLAIALDENNGIE